MGRSRPGPCQRRCTRNRLLAARSETPRLLGSDVSPCPCSARARPRRAPRLYQGDGVVRPAHAQSRSLAPSAPIRPALRRGNGRVAMTSRGPGRASRTPEMEEKELLRQQIRLLQGVLCRAGGRASLSFPSRPGGLPPAPRKRVALRPRALRPGRAGWGGRQGQAGGGGRGGAPGPAGSAPCPALQRGPLRRCGGWRLGGRLVTGGRRPPTPAGGHGLGIPRLPAPACGAAWRSCFRAKRGCFFPHALF